MHVVILQCYELEYAITANCVCLNLLQVNGRRCSDNEGIPSSLRVLGVRFSALFHVSLLQKCIQTSYVVQTNFV